MTVTEEPPPRNWVSQCAVAWAIDEAPVHPDLLATLIVIARRCDEQGRGSYQSIATLAEKLGKSEDQARRNVRKLVAAGLIREGDQSLPERNGVPRGKRPVVYDLVMELKGPKANRESRNPSGTARTPRTDATPGMDARGGMDAPPTPCMDAGSTPCMDATQTKPLNKPSNKPSLSPREDDTRPPTTIEHTPNRERYPSTSSPPSRPRDPVTEALVNIGQPPARADEIRQHLTETRGLYQPDGFFVTAAANGTLVARVAEAVAELDQVATVSGSLAGLVPRAAPRSPGARKSAEGLAVAERLDRRYGHGAYAPSGPYRAWRNPEDPDAYDVPL